MVRTRFAPSPTGYLHVGGLRTALYSYLVAKQNGGQFLLRIEDTDSTREVEGATESLMKTLAWAGLFWDEGPTFSLSFRPTESAAADEGVEEPPKQQKSPNEIVSENAQPIGGGDKAPYIQSQRSKIYETYVAELLSKGHAYRCFCTEARLEEVRQRQQASKEPTRYDGHCRTLTESEIEPAMSNGNTCVVRLKVPPNELIIFDDVIRGKVKFHSKEVDDQVLLKSDGMPTYHLANVVDDHLMEITHVIRGEEWLSSTPKHILLYQAFDWTPPSFAHLPLLLNADRSKLSKRQGDVAVEDYIAKGYSKEALLNFVCFLGWNPGGTKEIYSLSELVQTFDLSKVQKAGAVFNIEKLDWYSYVWKQRFLKEFAESNGLEMSVEETKNGYKINVHSDEDRAALSRELLKYCHVHLSAESEQNEHLLLRALYVNKEKILQEPQKVRDFITCYFSEADYSKELLINEKMKVDLRTAQLALEASLKALETLREWSENNIKDALMKVVEKLQLKNGQVLWPVRAALTGVEFSPGAFESAWVLGRGKSLERLQKALSLARNSDL